MDTRAAKLLEAAEAVVRARQVLNDAEQAFAAIGGFRLPGAAPALVRSGRSRTRRGGPDSVSARVKAALASGPLAFGEIVEAVGGRQNEVAARSALKVARAKGVVKFAHGKYRLKPGTTVSGPSKGTSRSGTAESSG